jgi:hypothetical protein
VYSHFNQPQLSPILGIGYNIHQQELIVDSTNINGDHVIISTVMQHPPYGDCVPDTLSIILSEHSDNGEGDEMLTEKQVSICVLPIEDLPSFAIESIVSDDGDGGSHDQHSDGNSLGHINIHDESTTRDRIETKVSITVNEGSVALLPRMSLSSVDGIYNKRLEPYTLYILSSYGTVTYNSSDYDSDINTKIDSFYAVSHNMYTLKLVGTFASINTLLQSNSSLVYSPRVGYSGSSFIQYALERSTENAYNDINDVQYGSSMYDITGDIITTTVDVSILPLSTTSYINAKKTIISTGKEGSFLLFIPL